MISVFACDNSDDDNRVNPGDISYEFFNDSRMMLITDQVFETLVIEPGDKTVFSYFFKAKDDINLSDDEYTESIFFEVDNSLDSFSLNDNDLRTTSLFIKRSCFCTNTAAVFPGIGSVSGTKLANGNWSVSISITFQWKGETEMNVRNISETFVPGEPITN